MTGARLARAPQHRPPWLVLVAALMLMSATRLGLSGLLTLRGQPGVVPAQSNAAIPAEEAPAKAIEVAMQRVEQRHPLLVKALAGFQLGIAMLVLYVVASIFTLDPRGRMLALLAAWVGVLYHAVNAVFGLAVVRPEILRVAPELARRLSSTISGSSAGEVEATIKALAVIMPLVTALFGILFCVVIMAFFGGRRGRRLYGLEDAAPVPQGRPA